MDASHDQNLPDVPSGDANPTPPASGGATPPSGVTPLVPRPVVTIIALGVLVILGWHIWYDARTESYEGWQVTILLGTIVFFVLGADVSKWLRGK